MCVRILLFRCLKTCFRWFGSLNTMSVLSSYSRLRNSRCARRVRHERLNLTLETPKMENIIKTQLYELDIVDCGYILLACYRAELDRPTSFKPIARAAASYSKTWRFHGKHYATVWQQAILRHFRVSPEIFELIMNSIVHSITDDIAWPGGSEPILPEKKLLVFLWYMANQETLREVSNTFAIGTTTVHEIVMTVSEAISENLENVSKNYGWVIICHVFGVKKESVFIHCTSWSKMMRKDN